jgi:serine/threonine protein kinase
MTPSWESLRRVIVEQWKLTTSEEWTTLQSTHQTQDELITFLTTKERFHTRRRPVAFVTPFMAEQLKNGIPQTAIVLVNSVEWLLLEKLGAGGMGEVWLVCQATAAANQLHALKRIKSTLSEDQKNETLKLAQREIQILSKIPRSKHLVKLIDTEHATGTMILELIDGTTLSDRTSELFRWPLHPALKLGIQICEAIKPLHDANFIHRDIKPSNIILTESSDAILIDLGLAETPEIATSKPGGTYYYIAPEVYRMQPVDLRSDLFSLAATMFSMLASQPPHFQQCLNLKKHTGRRAKLDYERFQFEPSAIDCDISDVRGDIPSCFQRLLARSLSAEPDSRPDNVVEFQKELFKIYSLIIDAVKIEKDLRYFHGQILNHYQDAHSEAKDYFHKPWREAQTLLDIMRDLSTYIRRLTSIALQPDHWASFEVIHQLVPGTIKLVIRFTATMNQLDSALTRHPESNDTDEMALIRDLNTTTLESMRQLSVSSLREAHAWRTVLLSLGAV